MGMVRNDEYDQIVAIPNGWQSPCKGENINKHESEHKDTSRIRCAFVGGEAPYLDIQTWSYNLYARRR